MSTNANIISFGSGLLFAKNLASATQQAILFGALQDVSMDVSGTTKTLFGQYQFPIAAARGETKVTGKAKVGQISGALYNSLFFGATQSTGTTSIAYNEAHSVPAATPWTITVTNSVTAVEDMGVIYANTGVPFTPVASGPTVGQYSYAAGVYTFATADANAAVLISYTYTTAAVGSTIVVGNPLQGVQPTFEVILSRSYNGVGERWKFFSCISSKLTLPTKMADFSITELDFEAFANAGGQTFNVYTDV